MHFKSVLASASVSVVLVTSLGVSMPATAAEDDVQSVLAELAWEPAESQLPRKIVEPGDPTVIPVDLQLLSGQSLMAEGPRAWIIDQAGGSVGEMVAPRVTDGNGDTVSTRFRVIGDDSLVLEIDHGLGTTYPLEISPLGYITTTFWLSRDDVERMWNVLQATGSLCSVIPLPYLGGVLCGAGSAVADAVSQAHYQKKRIKAVYHNCGFNYCNYYTYEVVS